MAIKKWFGRRSKSTAAEPVSVDDLIILQKWDEAEDTLKKRLRTHSRDLQASLKLAEVYEHTDRPDKAVEQYLFVADRYSSDGFFDKAIAVLSKAVKLNPDEGKLQLKIQLVDRMRRFEQRLSVVMRALAKIEGQVGTAATTSYLELRRVWGELAVSDLIEELNNEQLGRLLKSMELVRLGRDKTLVERGQNLEELFLLTRGQVEAVIELPNGEITVLRSFEPGDVIGDRSLFEHQPWSATYRTKESSVVLKLDRSGLEHALQGNPDPRGLLDALRRQQLDAKVAKSVTRTLGN